MRTTDINRAIARICAMNHGAINVGLASAEGLHHHALDTRARNGQLIQLAQGIYRTASVQPHWRQRALVACWMQGPEALLSHRAAAMLWGLDIERAPIEVLVPRWQRRTGPTAGFRVHEATDIVDADRQVVDGIPCTSVVRTLLDAAAVLPRRRSDELLEDALRKRTCSVDLLANRFVQVARRGRPGTRTMRELIAKRTGGYVPTMSEFERRTSELAVAAGLPEPERQHKVAVRDGFVYIDLAWPPRMLGIECDGLFDHADSVRLPWDLDRQNELQLQGWLILRFTWEQLTTRPQMVVAQLRAGHAR